MKPLLEPFEKIKFFFLGRLSGVRKRLLGVNNEHLDLLMDSFYKLEPRERNTVMAGLVAALILLISGAMGFYFSQVNSLKAELRESFSALHELGELKAKKKSEEQRFSQLLESIKNKTSDLRFKPFFEKLSRDRNVTMEGLEEREIAFPKDHPFDKSLKEVHVSMRLVNISLARLFMFLEQVEKAEHFLRIHDLKIRNRFGTRLYFDCQLEVRGYKAI